jgi:choline monooxygenase
MAAPVTAPVQMYLDPAIYEEERRAIFARTWQLVALESDLVRPGDYVAETIAGFPIFIIRDDHGQLHAFHNVCRHRAGPLVTDAKGRCDREIVCQFHDWRYAFDGSLRHAIGFSADAFDASKFGLFKLQVAAWRGFLFINMDMDAPPIAPLLQALDAKLGAQPRRPAKLRDRHPVACNWKVFTENYLDGYHREGVHPDLAPEEGAQRLEVQMEGDIAFYETPNRSSAAEGLWMWVWPNLGMSVYRGVLLIEHMRPDGPDRTIIDHIFLHEPEDPSVDAVMANSERITEEDTWVSERVQQNLRAGVYTQGVLSPSYEGAVAWFQRRVAEALGRELPGQSG